MSAHHFKVSIRLGNDAMQTSEDVANVLVEIAADLRQRGFERHAQSVHDYNGNRVGQHKAYFEGFEVEGE